MQVLPRQPSSSATAAESHTDQAAAALQSLSCLYTEISIVSAHTPPRGVLAPFPNPPPFPLFHYVPLSPSTSPLTTLPNSCLSQNPQHACPRPHLISWLVVQVGKFARMGSMLAKDSVRSRMDSESGISYTEFTYQLLQGYDFVHLQREHGCRVQVTSAPCPCPCSCPCP